jgi:transcriptional regulator with XRE-family HTH domain
MYILCDATLGASFNVDRSASNCQHEVVPKPKAQPQPRFGVLLRKYRQAAGVSLRGLARYLSIDPSLLSRVESGQRKALDFHYLVAIVERFQLKPEQARQLINAGYQARYGRAFIEPYEAAAAGRFLFGASGGPAMPATPTFSRPVSEAVRKQFDAELDRARSQFEKTGDMTTAVFGYITPEVWLKLMQIQGLIALHGAVEVTVHTLDGKKFEFVFTPPVTKEAKTPPHKP